MGLAGNRRSVGSQWNNRRRLWGLLTEQSATGAQRLPVPDTGLAFQVHDITESSPHPCEGSLLHYYPLLEAGETPCANPSIKSGLCLNHRPPRSATNVHLSPGRWAQVCRELREGCLHHTGWGAGAGYRGVWTPAPGCRTSPPTRPLPPCWPLCCHLGTDSRVGELPPRRERMPAWLLSSS